MVAPPRPPSSSLHCRSQSPPVLCNWGCSHHHRFFSPGAPLHPSNLSHPGPHRPPKILPPTSHPWKPHASNMARSPRFVPAPAAGSPQAMGSRDHAQLSPWLLPCRKPPTSDGPEMPDTLPAPELSEPWVSHPTPQRAPGDGPAIAGTPPPSPVPGSSVPAAHSGGAGGRQERMAEQSRC